MRSFFVAAAAVVVTTAAVTSADRTPSYSGAEWAAPGGDWAATRYSTLDQITRQNIARLGGAWSIELPDRQVSKAPILVAGGRMFVVSSAGQIFALDPATGKTFWVFKPQTPFK